MEVGVGFVVGICLFWLFGGRLISRRYEILSFYKRQIISTMGIKNLMIMKMCLILETTITETYKIKDIISRYLLQSLPQILEYVTFPFVCMMEAVNNNLIM